MSLPSPGDLRSFIARVAGGERLGEADAEAAFDAIMSGDATPAQMGGFLMALRVRGETVEEITGAARVMRAKALRVVAAADAVDTAGTGGDASGTINISTGAALVAAACGVRMAKHGNRALSSRSGSADVLTALGVNIDAGLDVVERSIAELGFGFLMAPRHHSATRHVAPTRVELGTRTIFNLLGPLSNPAGARRQLVGVYAAEWVEKMALVLGRLGGERAWVVHGEGGIDEISPAGETEVAELVEGGVRRFTVTPEEAGLKRHSLDAIKGGDPAANAAALRAVFAGERGAVRDTVLLNAAAVLVIADRAKTLREGAAIAGEAVDAGRVADLVDRLARLTRGSDCLPPGMAGVPS